MCSMQNLAIFENNQDFTDVNRWAISPSDAKEFQKILI